MKTAFAFGFRTDKGGLLFPLILLAGLMLFGSVSSATAQCDLQIAGAGPCLADGTYGTPAVGDDDYLMGDVYVGGTMTNVFLARVALAL